MFWPGRKLCCAEAPQKKYWRLQTSYWLPIDFVFTAKSVPPDADDLESEAKPLAPTIPSCHTDCREVTRATALRKHTSYSYTFIRSSPAKVYMLTTYIIYNVYIYIYSQHIHLFTCTHTHIYTHNYICIHIHMYTYTYIYIYLYMYICIHIYTIVYIIWMYT